MTRVRSTGIYATRVERTRPSPRRSPTRRIDSFALGGLPTGVEADGISVRPDTLTFGEEVVIDLTPADDSPELNSVRPMPRRLSNVCNPIPRIVGFLQSRQAYSP